MDTILYDYWRSTASYRVRIALGLAGVAWRSVPVDLVSGEQRGAGHLERNPQGLVPVLEIDGLRLTQSIAILEYMDETRNLGLLPSEAASRARVRALTFAISMEIHPVCNLRVAQAAKALSDGRIEAETWMRHFIGPGLAAVEAMLPEHVDGEFCHGRKPTMADLCLVPQLYNADRWGIDLRDMPKLRAIRAGLEELPAFEAAHPERCKSAAA